MRITRATLRGVAGTLGPQGRGISSFSLSETGFLTASMTDGTFEDIGHIFGGVSAPTNTAVPGISGSLIEGQTLTAGTGSWINFPNAYSYQWYRDSILITGATSSTYELTAGDVTSYMSVAVLASNNLGYNVAVSDAVGPVAMATVPLRTFKVSATDPAATYTTLAAVNAATFLPGDAILFRGEETFSGTLTIPSSGDATNRITFGAYGGGRPTISSGASSGVVGGTKAYVTVRDMIITGGGRTTTTISGVRFDNSTASQIKGPWLFNLDVSQYGKNGIEIIGSNSTHGFDNLRFSYCVAHDNTGGVTSTVGTAGIFVYAGTGYANPTRTHTDVVIDSCIAYSNTGKAGSTNFTGSGIFVSQAQNATIQYCEAYANGANSNMVAGGNYGIWTADSTSVTIQYCEAWGNLTATEDGGGFDLDGGCVNCTIQYCYSHGNMGSGYLLYTYPGDSLPATTGNTIRYNIAIDNGSAVAGGNSSNFLIRNDDTLAMTASVYGNTSIITSGAAASSNAISVVNNSTGGLTAKVANNLLQISHNGSYVASVFGTQSLTNITFAGNCYFANGVPDLVYWGAEYKTVGSWLANVVAQERVGGVFKAITSDPKLVAPSIVTVHGWDPSLLSGFQLGDGSPVADAGLDLNATYSISVGSVDFFGNTIPVGGGFAMGAHDRASTSATGEAAINATYTIIGTADAGQTGWTGAGGGMRDGNDATGYFSNVAGTTGTPQGIIADIGATAAGTKTLTKIEFRNFDAAADATNGLTVAVSADGTTWTEVGALSGATDNTLGTFYLGHRSGIRYIRARRATSGGVYAGLSDMIIYGYTAS